jgi:hypothetical protein
MQTTINLHEFVRSATRIIDADTESDVDIVFFSLTVASDWCDPVQFRRVLASWHGMFGTPPLNLLDGKVHNITEIAVWLGDEELALRLMALGTHLDVWRLITPRDVLKTDDISVLIALAKIGMLAIVAEEPR